MTWEELVYGTAFIALGMLWIYVKGQEDE